MGHARWQRTFVIVEHTPPSGRSSRANSPSPTSRSAAAPQVDRLNGAPRLVPPPRKRRMLAAASLDPPLRQSEDASASHEARSDVTAQLDNYPIFAG
jgi:hypothetical protein